MDNYKVQIKISKKLIPKIKDAKEQWKAIRDLIAGKKAEITFFEISEDEFERPSGLESFPEWNTTVKKDLLIESNFLLSDAESEKTVPFYMMIDSFLEKANMFEYIFEDESGLHVAPGYFQTDDFFEAPLDERYTKPKKETKQPGKQVDMFKKERKKKLE
jgi:hypothetical protein